MKSSSINPSTASGFTMVEVLVALVITSLLVSILMGLLFYVYRVQDTLRNEIVEREFDLQTQAWFTESLAACLPAAPASGNEFIGTQVEVTCDSLSPLRPEKILAPRRITLSVRRAQNNLNELVYSQQGDSQAASNTLLLLPEGEAGFSYYDSKGDEKATWPIAKNHPESLPQRIRLVVKQSGNIVFEWLATPQATPWLEPTLKNPFGFELPK